MTIFNRFLLLYFISFTLSTASVDAQDSLPAVKELRQISPIHSRQFLIPAVLVGTGVALNNSEFKQNFQNDVNRVFGKNFHSYADDILWAIPAAQLFAADVFGWKTTHRFVERSVNLITANLTTLAITSLSRSGFRTMRPDSTGRNSFPSQHTALAFTNATLLFHEYKDDHLLYACSGFTFATATGILRMANGKHWISDVATGAGIGIAVGTLIYYWNPVKKMVPSKYNNLSLFPSVGNGQFGVAIVYIPSP